MLKILNNNVLLCLFDPERTYRIMTDHVENYYSSYKSYTMKPKRHNARVKRNLTLGISGGTKESDIYSGWT